MMLKWCSICLIFIALSAAPLSASDNSKTPGDVYELRLSYKTNSYDDAGVSSGRSSGRQTMIQRVIAITENGTELELDLPEDTTDQDRAREWKLPARILKPHEGPMQLLNHAKLEARLDEWLKLANWTRDVCGRWIFTWNAFFIDCDPESVLEIAKSYDLDPQNYFEGSAFTQKNALGSAVFRRSITESGTSVLEAELPIDPKAICQSKAEGDVAVGEIIGEPIPIEEARRKQCSQEITGIVTETYFPMDSDGLIKLERIIKLKTTEADGTQLTETRNETLERRLIKSSDGAN